MVIEEPPVFYCAVCGIRMVETDEHMKEEYRGELYLFCSADCFKKFLDDPDKYVHEEEENGD